MKILDKSTTGKTLEKSEICHCEISVCFYDQIIPVYVYGMLKTVNIFSVCFADQKIHVNGYGMLNTLIFFSLFR